MHDMTDEATKETVLDLVNPRVGEVYVAADLNTYRVVALRDLQTHKIPTVIMNDGNLHQTNLRYSNMTLAQWRVYISMGILVWTPI